MVLMTGHPYLSSPFLKQQSVFIIQTLPVRKITMRIYISMTGNDHWPALNGLWAVLREDTFRPERLVILSPHEKAAGELERRMRPLLTEYGIAADIITSDDQLEAFNLAREDHQVALDITGGDNEGVARVLIHGDTRRFKHVFCLHTESHTDISKPFPLIDQRRTRLIDIMDEVL